MRTLPGVHLRGLIELVDGTIDVLLGVQDPRELQVHPPRARPSGDGQNPRSAR